MKFLRNESGVAMMMVLGTMLILSLLAAELVYETQVYNGVVFRQTDQLRAKLLARSALRLSLLQLTAAKKAKTTAKNMGLTDTSITDQIWQTPLVLPPPIPEGISNIEKSSLDAFKKSLGITGMLSVTIQAESDKLGLNELVWLNKDQQTRAATTGVASGGDLINPDDPTGAQGYSATGVSATSEQKKAALEAKRKTYAEIVSRLLEEKRQESNAFREKYTNLTGETLIGNLVAWMDPETTTDGESREKKDYYLSHDPVYSIKNAPLYSESELYMVKGFDEEIAKLFMDHFTFQSTSSINPNTASPKLLQAIIPELNEDDLSKIKTHIEETPFANAEDFWKFLGTLGDFSDSKKNLENQGIKLMEQETSYRVIITANSGQATKTWVAKIGSPPPAESSTTPSTPPATTKTPEPNPAPKTTTPGTKGNDDSDSLHIIYLKAD